MWCETVRSQSYATLFRHCAVLSVPAVLLRKLPNSSHDPAIPTERISKCAEALMTLLVNLLKDIATNQYQYCQIASRRSAPLK